MLKINQTFMKLFLLFAVALFIFLIATYFSLKPQDEFLEVYNQAWIKLGILFTFILLIVYFTIKSMSHKLLEDVEHFLDYLEEVTNKNYRAVVKIKYYREILEMSLRLKNIIKRLDNKDTKKK